MNLDEFSDNSLATNREAKRGSIKPPSRLQSIQEDDVVSFAGKSNAFKSRSKPKPVFSQVTSPVAPLDGISRFKAMKQPEMKNQTMATYLDHSSANLKDADAHLDAQLQAVNTPRMVELRNIILNARQ